MPKKECLSRINTMLRQELRVVSARERTLVPLLIKQKTHRSTPVSMRLPTATDANWKTRCVTVLSAGGGRGGGDTFIVANAG